jgi:hypothetical protein
VKPKNKADKPTIVSVQESLPTALDDIGMGIALRKGGSALIKINLARPPEPDHPRTDPGLLAEVIRFPLSAGYLSTICLAEQDERKRPKPDE